MLARNYVLTSYSLGARACLSKLPCRGPWYVALPLYQLNPLLRVCPAISFFDTRAAAEKGNEKENLQIPAAIKDDCFRDR